MAEETTELSPIEEMANQLRMAEQAMELGKRQELQVNDQPTSRNEALFSILAAALPTVLGAALGGKRGAIAGLSSGATAGGQFLSQREAEQQAREVEEENFLRALGIAQQKKDDRLEETLLKDELSRDRKREELELKKSLGLGSGTSVNVNTGDKLENRGKAKMLDILVDRRAAALDRVANREGATERIRRVIEAGRKSGAFKKKGKESVFDAIGRNFIADWDPSSEGAALNRELMNNMVRELREVSGAATTDSERALISRLEALGVNVKLDDILEIVGAIEAASKRNLQRIDKQIFELGIPVPGVDFDKMREQAASGGNIVEIPGLGKVKVTD